MSPHESFFSYNITRPYPFRWFTPLVIGGGIVVTVVSFLNVAASGYELAAISTTNPNKVRSGAEWFDSWSKWLASTRASCDPTAIPLQTGLYTNNTATLLRYRHASVSKSTYDATGFGKETILGSLVYEKDPLLKCNVTVQISIDANNRPATRVVESSVGAVLMANVECLLERHGEPTTYLELITKFGLNPSRSFSISLGNSSKSLWAGASLLAKYSHEVTEKYYLET